MKQDGNATANFGLSDSYENFSQLLKNVRKNAGFSATKIAAKTSVHPNSQGFYENKERDPNIDYLVAYSCSVGIPFWQLITRRIEMGSAPEEYKRSVLNEIGPLYQHIGEQSQGYKVNTVNEQAADDSAPEDNTHQLVSACYRLLESHQGNPAIKIFKQDGNSMSPTINNGDSLFVDTSKCDFTEGDLFVFKTGMVHSVKRIQFLPGGGIMLIADNPQYRSVNMDKDALASLEVQGKLVSSISHY
ncbi:MAG: hypothetical protein HRT35_12830 [Algicola sp.]|nr:hypothetical protein [Algicola sp.]